MDNPNNSTRLRRQNSLPSRLQRRSSVLPCRLRMRTNPYVGSFRHSPPTSLRSMEAGLGSSHNYNFAFSSARQTLRNSPYIGWFRHAPPVSIWIHKVDQKHSAFLDKCQAFAIILDRPEKTRPELADIINGHLRGGGKDKCYTVKSLDSTSFAHSMHSVLQESSNSSSSATVKLLAKLGGWFLFPLAYDADSGGYKECDCDKGLRLFQDTTVKPDSEDDFESDCGDDESSIALSDFDAPVTRPMSTSEEESPPKVSLDVSMSEIAQAYHAHQVIDQSEYSSLEGHRLDYVITQMDIARMARNASRHLDVDSILNLPTVTYRSPSPAVPKQASRHVEDSRDPDEAWSFIMVPQSERSVEQAASDTSNDGCVICLEQFKDGERLRVLPCDHSFHVGCIDRWLSGSHSHLECFTSGCPTCKTRPDEAPISNDGSVPSWAFAKLGAELARSPSSMNE